MVVVADNSAEPIGYKDPIAASDLKDYTEAEVAEKVLDDHASERPVTADE